LKSYFFFNKSPAVLSPYYGLQTYHLGLERYITQ
jgi:hypothetical protein